MAKSKKRNVAKKIISNKQMNHGLVFVGVFFVGLGLGTMYGSVGAGALIGLGLGFLAMYYFRNKA